MMTFIEKFDALKDKYGKIDESKLTDSFAIQVEMTDDDCGGIFYVAYMNSVFAIEPYDYHDNTAAITTSSKVLENVLSGKADPVAQFLTGKLKVKGNLDHALMLVKLMKKEPKKRTAKKAAEKNEAKEEKKAEAKAEAKPEAKTEKKVEAKPEKKAEAKAEKKAEVKAEAKPEKKAEKKTSKKASE